MENMTIPTSIPTPRWTSLPSYAPSLVTCEPVGDFFGVAPFGGGVLVGAVARSTRHVGAGVDLAGAPSFDRSSTRITRNKDIRPGSRAWSPPV